MKDAELRNVIEPVEEFVNTTLTPELRNVLLQKEKLSLQHKDYDWLLKELTRQLEAGEGLPKTSNVDLGAIFFCEATVKSEDRLHVLLGYGFVVEMTRPEAIAFCKSKLQLLEKRIDFMEQRAQTVEGHIKQLLYGVSELRISAEVGLE